MLPFCRGDNLQTSSFFPSIGNLSKMGATHKGKKLLPLGVAPIAASDQGLHCLPYIQQYFRHIKR